MKCLKKCYECPLGDIRDSSGEQLVWGDFPKKRARVVIVGEAPGGDEAATGRPFIGTAGRLLNEMLREAGIDRSRLAILNAVKCRPPDNRPPKPDELAACSKYLFYQIKHLRPEIIVPMGNISMSVFTGQKSGIVKLRGQLRKSEVHGKEYLILPTLHPIYVGRQRGDRDRTAFTNVVKDLKKAWSLAYSKTEPIQHHYLLATKVEQVQKLTEFLIDQPAFAFDTETTGLDPRKCKVLGASFSADSHTGYYVPFWVYNEVDGRLYSHWKGEDRKLVRKYMRDLMRCDAKKIGHNLLFDIRIVQAAWNVKVNNVYFDTMLAAHLLDENSSVALGNLADRYFVDLVGFKNQVYGIAKNKSDGYGSIPLEHLWPYACADADATWRLFEKYKKELKVQRLLRVFHTFEMSIMKTLVNMIERGIAIDIAQLSRLRSKYEKQYARLLRSIERKAGFAMNPNGRKDMLRLVGELGISLPPTKSGGPATGQKVLEEHAKEHPVLQKIVDARKVQKSLSTYVDGIGKRLSDDNRIRADFAQIFAVTGRLSCRNPNLQNIKRDTDLQNIFVAGKGMRLFYADFSQMELRVMSWYAQDPAMLEAWKRGVDFHQMTAAAIFSKKFRDVTKEERHVGKSMNFALTYGSGVMGLVHNFGVPLDQAQRLYDKYFEAFPAVAKWHDETIAFCRENLHVRNAFGRIRRIPTINSMDRSIRNHAEHQAVNSPVQSAAWQFCGHNMSLAEKFCEEKGHGAGLVTTVHDSVIFEIPKKKSRYYSGELASILITPVEPIDVPMSLDIAVCDRWGDVADED